MTKRTRQRNMRAKPTAPPEPEMTNVELHATELSAYWTRLQHAVARDSAGMTSDGGRGGGANVHASVVNTDVVSAMVEIRRGVEQLEAEAAALLRLDRGGRSTLQVIEHLADWHRSLAGRRMPLARHIDQDLARWAGTARRALRLESLPQPFGHNCPYHRATDPTPLMVAPDRAHLHYDVLHGRRPPKGHAPLRWEKGEAVSCSTCGRRWSGMTEQRVLAKLLREATGDG